MRIDITRQQASAIIAALRAAAANTHEVRGVLEKKLRPGVSEIMEACYRPTIQYLRDSAKEMHDTANMIVKALEEDLLR